MVESVDEYIIRKMQEVQNLIQEATEAKALGNPIINDQMDAGGACILITIRINEPKLVEYRRLAK